MLNQSYMWPQVYDSYVLPKYRSWEYRLPLLAQTIKDDNVVSDIMCFQEMEGASYTSVWKPMMAQMGYDGAFIQKGIPGYWKEEQDTNLIDGVSIFFDTNKFELLDTKKVVISKYFQNEFKNWYGIKLNSNQIDSILSARNQVGLILTLRHKSTGESFIVSNTHLYWKNSEIKLIQAMVLLEAIVMVKEKYPSARVLFAGDFNSEPTSPVYRFLKEDRIEASDPALAPFIIEEDCKYVINPVGLPRNVFDTIIEQDELFTCYTQHLFGIFDYIWYNPQHLNLLGFLSGVDSDYTNAIEGLPNEFFPSDHIPLVAEFEIKP